MRNLLIYAILLFFFLSINESLFAQIESKVEAAIGSGVGDSVRRKEFIAQLGVRGYVWVNNYHTESTTVDSFRLFVMRGDTSIVFSTRTIGNQFNEETNNFFKQLETGDKVIVYDICTTSINNKRKHIPPLEYIIK